jgi:sialate O-acetylesterase
LALFAKGIVYKENIIYSGPIYDCMVVENNQIRLYFTHIGGGLKDKNGGTLKGFKIAGSDGVFKNAEGVIDGDTVVVQSKEVQNPIYVRYAWEGDPVAELYNVDGLPASPFRTDSKL